MVKLEFILRIFHILFSIVLLLIGLAFSGINIYYLTIAQNQLSVLFIIGLAAGVFVLIAAGLGLAGGIRLSIPLLIANDICSVMLLGFQAFLCYWVTNDYGIALYLLFLYYLSSPFLYALLGVFALCTLASTALIVVLRRKRHENRVGLEVNSIIDNHAGKHPKTIQVVSEFE